MTTAAARKREKFARQFHSPEFVEWSKMQPSAVSFRYPTVCAHNPSRAAGGPWRDITPLTDSEHREQHAQGVETFQAVHGINFEQTNAQHTRAWETHNG